MAKKKGVRITIVVEDEALERFSREVLLKSGFSRHELRVTPYPVGQGSAKDWVDKQYPVEVKTLRRKGYQNLGMVVGTDADELTVMERMNRLAKALQNEGVRPRGDRERIVLWIPKWNIETWLLYFAGEPRDDDFNYKNDVTNPDYRATAQAFVDEYRQYKTNDTIATQPSLEQAYKETQRLGL